MALSPEEERELALLKRQASALAQREQGGQKLAKARGSAPSSFSTWRATVGSVRDAVEGVVSTIDDIGDALGRKTGVGGIAFGSRASNGVVEYQDYGTFKKGGGDSVLSKGGVARLSELQGSENAGTAERITRGIGSFLVPFVGWSKAFKATEAATLLGRAGRTIAAGSVVNFTSNNAVEANLANTLKDFGFNHKALDALSASEDDEALVNRTKAVISNLPLDIAGEAAVEGIIAAARAYKTVRAGSKEAREAAAATAEDLRVQRKATKKVDQTREDMGWKPEPGKTQTAVQVDGKNPLAAPAVAPRAANDVENVADAEKLLAPAKPKPVAPEGEAAELPALAPTAPPAPKVISSLEDFSDYIAQAVKAIPADQAERLDKIAKALVENPQNALDELDLDPLKLDYSMFDDAEKIVAMQNSLASVVNDIAAKTGRAGRVVSNAETVRTARLLGSTPKVMRDLVEKTRGLPTTLTAARLLVGQHAHKLVSDVDAAIAEITKGGRSGAAYNQFTETLARHAHLLGTLRGASAEVGRTLQSLQITLQVKEAGKAIADQAEAALAKARQKAAQDALRVADKAAKGAQKEADKVAKAAARQVDIGAPEVTKFLEGVANHQVDDAALEALAQRHGISVRDVVKQLGLDWSAVNKLREAERKYTDLFKDLSTDAGKLRLLNQLKNAKGDLQQLTRITKSRDMTWLQRIDAGVQETRGSLFSVGTAAMNVLGAGSIMTLRTLNHALAAMGHAAISPASARHAEAARTHMLKTWASVHAPISAFGDAMSNAWAVIKHDTLEEGSLLADAAGFSKKATELQARAMAAESGITRGIVREDMGRGPAIYISPETLARVSSQVEQFPIGRFGQMGLSWLLKAGATSFNAAGSATRLANTLFINAPDQLAGTLAARAGAHSAAIEKAAEEAAEAGLIGADLHSYIKQRAFDLADGIDGISPDPFDDGVREVLEKEGLDYSKAVLFQDELESGAARWASGIHRVPIFGSLVAPFVKTPLRILERTLFDYSPLGLLKNSVREAWATGDAAVRGEIAARHTMAMSMFMAAYALAEDRQIVGYDGGSRSSARLDRAPYTLRIGGDVWEYNRLDPVGTVLGMAADLREAIRANEDREIDDMGDLLGATLEAAFWPIFKNILNKTWMQSFKQLTDIMSDPTYDGYSDKFSRYLASLSTRAVPLSGIQRQFDKWDTGVVREARGFTEGILKSSWGASSLPVKRDAILGRPVDMTAGERTVGVKGGPETNDPLERELEQLSFDIPALRTKIKGVSLSSSQISRWLELRGQIVRDQTGLTLEEKLTQVIQLPEYQELGHNGRVETIKEAMKGYSTLATQQLLREDNGFAYSVLKQEVWDDMKSQDRTRDEADKVTRRMAQELGIMPSE